MRVTLEEESFLTVLLVATGKKKKAFPPSIPRSSQSRRRLWEKIWPMSLKRRRREGGRRIAAMASALLFSHTHFPSLFLPSFRTLLSQQKDTGKGGKISVTDFAAA